MNEHDTTQVAAYALDALDHEERAAFEEHLSGCAECRQELVELQQVVGLLPLALDPIEPRDDVRDRIIAAVTQEADARPALRVLDGAASQRGAAPRTSWLAGAAGLVAAAAIAALAIWNVQLQSSVKENRDSAALARQVVVAESHHPVIASLPGRGLVRGATARVIIPRQGDVAFVEAERLPAAPPGKVYQLWAMTGPTDSAPLSIGVLQSHGQSVQIWRVARPSAGHRLAAFTVEPGPNGSRVPTTAPVMVGAFKA